MHKKMLPVLLATLLGANCSLWPLRIFESKLEEVVNRCPCIGLGKAEQELAEKEPINAKRFAEERAKSDYALRCRTSFLEKTSGYDVVVIYDFDEGIAIACNSYYLNRE